MDKLTSPLLERVTIDVAVGIVTNSLGQVLVAERPSHWLGGGFWEFPGGKVEVFEDSLAAVKRELHEEVALVIDQCSPLIRLSYHYPERTVILHAWKIMTFSGEARGVEGQKIAWQYPASLNHIRMLPANRAIVAAIQLPNAYLITPSYQDRQTFLETLTTRLQRGDIKLLQLRAKQLQRTDYTELAQSVLELCRHYGVTLLLNHPEVNSFEGIDADGLHLSSEQLWDFSKRPIGQDKWLAASCHNVPEIVKAEELGVDFIVISAVRDSSGNKVGMGWEKFEELVGVANVPVFALGGMELADVKMVRKFGGQGVAGIRGLWR